MVSFEKEYLSFNFNSASTFLLTFFQMIRKAYRKKNKSPTAENVANFQNCISHSCKIMDTLITIVVLILHILVLTLLNIIVQKKLIYELNSNIFICFFFIPIFFIIELLTSFNHLVNLHTCNFWHFSAVNFRTRSEHPMENPEKLSTPPTSEPPNHPIMCQMKKLVPLWKK